MKDGVELALLQQLLKLRLIGRGRQARLVEQFAERFVCLPRRLAYHANLGRVLLLEDAPGVAARHAAASNKGHSNAGRFPAGLSIRHQLTPDCMCLVFGIDPQRVGLIAQRPARRAALHRS